MFQVGVQMSNRRDRLRQIFAYMFPELEQARTKTTCRNTSTQITKISESRSPVSHIDFCNLVVFTVLGFRGSENQTCSDAVGCYKFVVPFENRGCLDNEKTFPMPAPLPDTIGL